MIPTIYLTVISVPILYFFFAFTKSFWVKVFFNINVCAFCLAVGTTWLWMLIARAFGLLEIDSIALAILLGNTIVGMMWKFEDYYKNHDFKRWYIIRLFYFVGAQLLVYYVVTTNSDFLYPAIAGILAMGVSGFLFFKFSQSPKSFWNDITRKNIAKEGLQTEMKVVEKGSEENKNNEEKVDNKDAKSKLDEMFENCC